MPGLLCTRHNLIALEIKKIVVTFTRKHALPFVECFLPAWHFVIFDLNLILHKFVKEVFPLSNETTEKKENLEIFHNKL